MSNNKRDIVVIILYTFIIFYILIVPFFKYEPPKNKISNQSCHIKTNLSNKQSHIKYNSINNNSNSSTELSSASSQDEFINSLKLNDSILKQSEKSDDLYLDDEQSIYDGEKYENEDYIKT